MQHNLEGLKIRPGAASMSFDIVRKGGTTVATVWSGSNPPSEEQARANAEALVMAMRGPNPDGPYRPKLAEAFRSGARELCNCDLGDRICIDDHATVEPADAEGVLVHCKLYVSDADRAEFAGEEGEG